MSERSPDGKPTILNHENRIKMTRKAGIIHKLRLAIALVYMMMVLIFLSVTMTLLMLLSLGRLQNFLIKWGGFLFGRTIPPIAGVRIRFRYHNEKPAGPAIFVVNHSSTLDLFVITAMMLPRVRYIAKRELGYNPFFWIITKVTGQIMIDRKDSRKVYSQLNKAYDYIRRNRLSLLFAPEGTRMVDGKIGPFKPGAFHAAIDLGYPIVPIFIDGAWDLCPGKSLTIRPGTVTVHFHKEIDTSGWEKSKVHEYREALRNKYLQWNGEEPAS